MDPTADLEEYGKILPPLEFDPQTVQQKASPYNEYANQVLGRGGWWWKDLGRSGRGQIVVLPRYLSLVSE